MPQTGEALTPGEGSSKARTIGAWLVCLWFVGGFFACGFVMPVAVSRAHYRAFDALYATTVLAAMTPGRVRALRGWLASRRHADEGARQTP